MATEYPILLDQLCIGLFVHVDTDDGRKSFKIKKQSQIDKIRSLGLEHVICVLDKSDGLPIPLERVRGEAGGGSGGAGGDDAAGGGRAAQGQAQATEEEKVAEAPKREGKTPVSKELLGFKRETVEKNKQRRKAFKNCEKRYDGTVAQVAVLIRRAGAGSAEGGKEAVKVVDQLVDTFLSDQDVVINLITTKPTEVQQNHHALNVTILCMMLGKSLNLQDEAMRILGLGALFHDIGKGRMPVKSLSGGKDIPLARAVDQYYQQHPKIGAQLASQLPEFPPAASRIILEHHETVDGSGFPNKLPVSKITPPAMVVHVADAYDNLCNNKDPDKSLTPHDAFKYMYNRMRQKMNKRVLELFIKNLGVYPPGTVVQLSNGLVGMVVSTNPARGTRPGVLVHHPEIPKKEALIVDLAIEEQLNIVKAIHPKDLPRDIYSYLSPTRHMNYYADTVPKEGA